MPRGRGVAVALPPGRLLLRPSFPGRRVRKTAILSEGAVEISRRRSPRRRRGGAAAPARRRDPRNNDPPGRGGGRRRRRGREADRRWRGPRDAVIVGSHACAGQAGAAAEDERRAEAAGAQVGAADSGCSGGGGGARRRHGRSRGVVPLVQRAHTPLPAIEALVQEPGHQARWELGTVPARVVPSLWTLTLVTL
jgi:hypothetical protein